MSTTIWEATYDAFAPNAMFAAGVLFGAGWWVWGDAIAAVHGDPFNAVYLTPGLVATLAILIMNSVPRSELNDSVYGDDASLCRSRLTLFLSYVFSVASIAGAVAILLTLKANAAEDLWIGAAAIIQACLVIASGLVAWFFKDHGGEEYSFIY